MLTGPLPDALTVIQVVNSLSDTYPAQVVELYEDTELVGSFQTRQHAFVRGYYKLAVPTHTILFAARAALWVFLGDRAERPVTVLISPTAKSSSDGDQMQEHLDQVMMAAAFAKDAVQQRWATSEVGLGGSSHAGDEMIQLMCALKDRENALTSVAPRKQAP